MNINNTTTICKNIKKASFLLLKIPAFLVPAFLFPRSVPGSVPRFPVPGFKDSVKVQ